MILKTISDKKPVLTQARLKELMDYDPEFGIFTWKRPGQYRKTEQINKSLMCYINKKHYQCHRLAWLWMYGYIPEGEIIHVNQIKTDNRIENLEERSSRYCLLRSSMQVVGTSSGVKGVYWAKRDMKWCAQIRNNGKYHNLGLYRDKDNAVCARLAAEQCLGWDVCDPNSPAYQYVQEMLSK